MRAAPGPIPDRMPSLEQATRDITHLLDMPRVRLVDHALSRLVNEYSDGSPKWLTGSTVWLPAVFGQVDKDTDLDIVFQTADGLNRFIDGTLATLNSKMAGYTATVNGNNGKRILHPDGEHIIDAWSLEADESITELLMTFPHNYQRCAYFITWSGSSVAYLTRTVKERPRFRPAERAVYGGSYGR